MNLFYPSHDIALANGVRHFNPPAAALRLQEDLASLSDIWNQPYLRHQAPMPLPWGWDWDTRRHLHEAYHIAYANLPDDADLALIRQLSSRQTMLPLISGMEQRLGTAFACHPTYLTSLDEVLSFIRQHDEAGLRFVLKTPWSSSGRGLTLSTTPRDVMLRHAQATLKRMGGIMGEDWIEDKRHDFALLFFAPPTDVRFIGYSLFDNDEAAGGTTYRQGYLLSNAAIEQRLGIDPAYLHTLIQAAQESLTELLHPLFGKPWPLGYLGIDMIACQGVQPIELNLRTTMGTVCRLYHDAHPSDGLFRISPLLENGHFQAEFLTSQ